VEVVRLGKLGSIINGTIIEHEEGEVLLSPPLPPSSLLCEVEVIRLDKLGSTINGTIIEHEEGLILLGGEAV